MYILARALAVSLLITPIAAYAVTIDFDEVPAITPRPIDTYDAQGVNFDQILYVNTCCGLLPSSAPNVAYSSNFDISGSFVGPVKSVSFISVFAGDSGGDVDTVTLRGYDTANNLVASDTFTATSAQTLQISGSGITRFEIIQIGAIAIDDFTFLPETQIPEPSTFALCMAALFFGVSVLKRFKS
jgi:hypothetical protein